MFTDVVSFLSTRGPYRGSLLNLDDGTHKTAMNNEKKTGQEDLTCGAHVGIDIFAVGISSCLQLLSPQALFVVQSVFTDIEPISRCRCQQSRCSHTTTRFSHAGSRSCGLEFWRSQRHRRYTTLDGYYVMDRGYDRPPLLILRLIEVR